MELDLILEDIEDEVNLLKLKYSKEDVSTLLKENMLLKEKNANLRSEICELKAEILSLKDNKKVAEEKLLNILDRLKGENKTIREIKHTNIKKDEAKRIRELKDILRQNSTTVM